MVLLHNIQNSCSERRDNRPGHGAAKILQSPPILTKSCLHVAPLFTSLPSFATLNKTTLKKSWRCFFAGFVQNFLILPAPQKQRCRQQIGTPSRREVLLDKRLVQSCNILHFRQRAAFQQPGTVLRRSFGSRLPTPGDHIGVGYLRDQVKQRDSPCIVSASAGVQRPLERREGNLIDLSLIHI